MHCWHDKSIGRARILICSAVQVFDSRQKSFLKELLFYSVGKSRNLSLAKREVGHYYILTLWYHSTFFTGGFAFVWHSKYTSSPERRLLGSVMREPKLSDTIGVSGRIQQNVIKLMVSWCCLKNSLFL